MVTTSRLTLLAGLTAMLASASPMTNLHPRQVAPPSAPSTLPLNLTYAFTAILTLGSPSSSSSPSPSRPQPIPIPGGVLITEPISSGTVTGPLINATVQGGLAVPAIYYNQTVQAPSIYLYGTTADGRPFYVEEIGTGRPDGQVTRIRISVNSTGNVGYGRLVEGFVLASVNPNANGTRVEVVGYLVDNSAVFGL